MNVHYQLYPTLEDAEKVLNPDAPLFSDTETDGFYGKVKLIQLYQEHLDHVVMVEEPNEFMLSLMLGRFDTKWHNAHYDITTLQQQTSTRWVPEKFDDTFLLGRLAFPHKEKFALDEIFQYVLGYCPYTRQGLDKKILQKSKWRGTLSTKQYLYAATDVYFMPQVWEAVKGFVDEMSYRLDMHTLRYCLDFQWNGMPTSDEAIEAQLSANNARIAEIGLDINVNSYVQVRKFLDCTESDDLALATMHADGLEDAGRVRETRKLIKQNSFLAKFQAPEGRIFGKFLPSARSGRLTSKDQNLQQLPRKLKGMFQAPEGRVLIYSDYAQLELRTICAITHCLNMEQLFRNGEDLHGFTAKGIFGDDWGKNERNLSKTYNFNFLYGGGIMVLLSILLVQAGIKLSESQGVKDRRKWRRLWPEIYAWQERGISAWRNKRLGKTPLGRRYLAKMMTDQLNIENQGAGAEVAKLALHYFYPKLKEYNAKHNTDFMVCNFIHDSFITEGPNEPEHYKAVSVLKAECMQQAWFEMSRCFKIKDLPMPVDVIVGTNWGDIEDDDEPNIWEFTLEGMVTYVP
ncbi:DNA polymerase [Pseudoalteromonas phage PH1]|uniref:DNA polymerase n=1 Tax=Pseudoalteromonas phage PH1 TaxID=1874540 RepID=UPI00081983C4|nr:DNA polymerase [Pseudoalteromonas phage PH1]ANY29522.1 DNA polymerase I [Pseudoalteromonas phage PH1]